MENINTPMNDEVEATPTAELPTPVTEPKKHKPRQPKAVDVSELQQEKRHAVAEVKRLTAQLNELTGNTQHLVKTHLMLKQQNELMTQRSNQTLSVIRATLHTLLETLDLMYGPERKETDSNGN